jgi:hypothetical protein
MKNYSGLLILFAVVLSVQFVLGWVIILSIDEWTDRGTFGDMFGAVNTLFSGLAFAGVIFAIILQSKELELQRSELRQSREQFEIGNKLTKMELLNDFYARYDSLHFRQVRRNAAKLLLAGQPLPIDDFDVTAPVDAVLNFFQELGLAQKHGVLEVTFVAGRFGGSARCYYAATREYIARVRNKEGLATWESIEELISESERTVPILIDDGQVISFLKGQLQLPIDS